MSGRPLESSFELSKIELLKGVGPQMAEKLAKLGIVYFRDLLFHLPIRYIDQTQVTDIADLRPNMYAVIEGRVASSHVAYGKRRSLMCKVSDETGSVHMRFFHFTAAQKNRLAVDTQIRVFGEIRRGATGLEFYHPETETLDAEKPLSTSLTPIYPTTDGVTQKRWLQLTDQIVQRLKTGSVNELLSEDVRKTQSLAPLSEALIYLHRPPVDADLNQLSLGLHPHQCRLAVEELLAHHLSLKAAKQQTEQYHAFAFSRAQAKTLEDQFLDRLTFKPTGAQSRVIDEICADLKHPQPMKRLVQGDVGSGKTLVAAIATLQAAASGKQTALMAPTEILAEQHFQNFRQWLEPLGVQCAWLVGKQGVKQRREQLESIRTGEALVVVGTQALFQEAVEFHDLALTIIDEQHRFGVHQRLALQEKGQQTRPHQLSLTATPIPRTLAMSFYANIDISSIDELPPGRTPISTAVIGDGRRGDIVTRVGDACREGRQAYWVCTLIEESESLQAQAAEATWQELSEALSDIRVGLIHGRMTATEKDEHMRAFKAQELDLLVATTVIEVGVDVPNASLMIIENPERLGLAQLHQLRGRVGRGKTESHCVLLYQSPLSKVARKRLDIMRSTTDGFVIAEEDLKIRGPGEVLGTRQTGEIQFRVANLDTHQELLEIAVELGETISQQHPASAKAIVERWLGSKQQFANV
ncbi:ATP-dependent DNA helicase RecG [Sessilibacter corallicola]|uniref:ATP-dependent DNA helicase RecG n=1 Tax=Sessilibacter corallicola TaxID=2904075 RepID=A0ABQ0A641_9GAMM